MSISCLLRSQPRLFGLGLQEPTRPGPPQQPLYQRPSSRPDRTGHFYLALTSFPKSLQSARWRCRLILPETQIENSGLEANGEEIMIHLNQDVREPGSLVRKGLLLLWATAVGCGIVGGPAVGVAQGADPAKGLLGHWRFEGDVSDSSGNGKNGVAKGDPQFVKGKVGKAIKLDGRSQFVEIAKLASGVTQFTIAAWIHVDKMPSPKAFSSIYHNNGWEVGDVHLPFAGEKGVMDLGIKGNEPSMSVPSFQVKDLQGRWVHLAVSYNADEKKDVRFYLEGQPKDVFKIEKAHPVKLGPGRVGTWDVEGRWFNGLIDELYIYQRALTAEEIEALFELASKKQ